MHFKKWLKASLWINSLCQYNITYFKKKKKNRQICFLFSWHVVTKDFVFFVGHLSKLQHQWTWPDALHQHRWGCILSTAACLLYRGNTPLPSIWGRQTVGLQQGGKGQSWKCWPAQINTIKKMTINDTNWSQWFLAASNQSLTRPKYVLIPAACL